MTHGDPWNSPCPIFSQSGLVWGLSWDGPGLVGIRVVR